MYTLRFSWLWVLSALSLVAMVIYGSLATGGPVSPVTINDKLVHMLSYTFLMLWFGGMIRRPFQWWVVLVLFAMGVGLEFIQGLGGERMFEKADMAMNGLGLVVGKKLCRMGLSGWCQVFERIVLRRFS